MKNIFFALFIFSSFNLLAQVGIGTTVPTADLDIDGTLRVRSLGSGTLTSDADGNISAGPKLASLGKVSANGTAINVTGATVVRINKGDYMISFDTPLNSDNYVIMLNLEDCGGGCDGNGSYDDAGISYYGQTKDEFYVNIGDSDNGNSAKKDVDLEFMFLVYDF